MPDSPLPQNTGLRWIPFDGPDVDDSCVTVTLIGCEPRDYWAKADGIDPETGCTRYKLLPVERG